MANGTFFISWQLWEEMTFVLAMGIVTVFLVGLAKLWWTNRHMRKIEELDAEKQARAAQMRKSGLLSSTKTGSGSGNGHGGEIPFGIKAIESGAEVEGIWVARMASMASRPPDRKWSSKRKVKKMPGAASAASAASAALLEMDELSPSPSKRVRRGSSRASRISRREIVEPSSQTRVKLESLSLLEEERLSRDTAGREKASGNYVTDGQARKVAAQDRTPQSGHKGPLGRIQRSLKKKMTSTETYDSRTNKRQSSGESVREFHEQAEARKPQRFYPVNSTTSQAVSNPRTQITHSRVNSLASEDNMGHVGRRAGQAGPSLSGQPHSGPRNHDSYYQASPNSSSSSVETFVTTSELPKEYYSPVSQQPPLEQHPALADGTPLQDPGAFSPRRSSRSTQHSLNRLSSEDSSSLRDAHDMATPAHRYPPNSSRSATVAHSRPQSSTQYQQQQQQSAPSSTQPSPVLGPSDTYVNVTKRKVNNNFEVLPAGTFGGFPEHMYDSLPGQESASAEASVRSSFDSKGSGGGKKPRKKLRKKSISSQYSK